MKQKMYNQSETSKLTGFPQSTLSDISKRRDMGVLIDRKKMYTESEVEFLKNFKIQDHVKVIDIIKNNQPIELKKICRKSPFGTEKTMKLLTEITGTLDDPPIDSNIWEDHDEKLYYGNDCYKNKFFGEY